MILYGADTPNVLKAAVCLEEMRLDWRLVHVDLAAGAQRTPAFRALNPNAKLPVLVDGARTVWESGAILLYLADHTGAFAAAPETLSWVFWQVSGYGPSLGQAIHFRGRLGEEDAYARTRFLGEALRLWDVLETRLLASRHLGGQDYGLADMAVWPWAVCSRNELGLSWSAYPATRRWARRISQRRAVRSAVRRFAVS
jgi:GSH-dependent disulfide-bond oxidoreductase